MEEYSLIKKFLKDFSNYPLEEIETGLVRYILECNQIQNLKNKYIKKIIGRKTNTQLIKLWLTQNKAPSSIKMLERVYELRISNNERKINGAYYTPSHIVKYITRQTINNIGTVCDPACGSGAFLIEASKLLKSISKKSYREIFSKYIFGIDILPSSVKKTKLILSLLAIIEGEDREKFKFNVFQGDSLTFDWSNIIDHFPGFDFIVGNPPYVRTRNLSNPARERIKKWTVGRFGNADIYIPFFELAVSWSNPKGRIGYITPNTYLTSLNARLLRAFLSKDKYVEKIIDFNGWQIFEGATTYTCITFLNKQGGKRILFTLTKNAEDSKNLENLKFNSLPSDSLGDKEWRLLSGEDAENILKIEKAGSPLYKYVDKFVTGIATLNNNLFLIDDNGKRYLNKEFNGRNYFIEREITRKIIKPNRIKDWASLKNNRERIIYPYQLRKGKIELMDTNQIRNNFPETYKYLLAIKSILVNRDKGKKQYKGWYAYGRTQGLNNFGKKIILPMIGSKPAFMAVKEEDSLIYCGYAIFPKKEKDFEILEKVLNSDVMWYYIKNTSKNYAGGFKSFAKNYIKNFSIPKFSNTEEQTILKIGDKSRLNNYLWKKYQLV
jgi:hypothetical protein